MGWLAIGHKPGQVVRAEQLTLRDLVGIRSYRPTK
jgi:hypothetical protein